MKLLFEAAAPVAAPIDSVRALIDDGWVLDAFLGRADARAYVDVDHRPGVVGFQGHWWYRGEISAAPAGTGTTSPTASTTSPAGPPGRFRWPNACSSATARRSTKAQTV